MRPMAVSVQRERENCCQQQLAAACCSLLQLAATCCTCCSKQQHVNYCSFGTLVFYTSIQRLRYCDPKVSFEVIARQLVADSSFRMTAVFSCGSWLFLYREGVRENCCQQQPVAACCSLLQQAAACELLFVRNISVFHQHSAAMYRRYCDPIVSFGLSTWQLVATAAARCQQAAINLVIPPAATRGQ